MNKMLRVEGSHWNDKKDLSLMTSGPDAEPSRKGINAIHGFLMLTGHVY